MAKVIDLTGQTFGRLTVIERAPNQGEQTMWLCRCSCKQGTEVITRGGRLKSGATKSCGCLSKKHGMSGTKIHNVWRSIKGRCNNPNNKEYHKYGGRGIKIYPEWENDFQAFYDYVSKLPHFGEKGYSLDRIDNDKGYEPDNLRFADNKTQTRNTRRNIWVEYQGETMCLKDAAAKSGIHHNTLCGRYHNGDRGEYLFRPVK